MDKQLVPHPQVAVVWDVQPDGPDQHGCLTRSKTPVTIKWTAKDFNLKVVFVPEPKCPIPQPECKGSQCTTTIPSLKTERAEAYRCTYEIHNLSKVGQIDLEGDVIVVPCCM